MRKLYHLIGNKFIITIIILLGLIYIKYFIGIKFSKDYIMYGKVTKIEKLDSVEPQIIIYRMSKFPQKGQIKIISLEKYIEGGYKWKR